MKKVILILTLLLITHSAFPQKEKVKWYTIEEAEKLAAANPRPIIVDTYTDWCGWCKKLDADTFTHPVIADILNNRFYPVKFDAEGSKPVTFQGRIFINDGKAGNSHQLAVAMLRGQMGYPNLVFFNEEAQLLTNLVGYKNPKELEPFLQFFAEKAYLKQNIDDFLKSFKSKIE